MDKVRLAILCPSEIAYRRFMPALKENDGIFSFAGVAYASGDEWASSKEEADKYNTELLPNERRKAQAFVDNYGGALFASYNEMLSSADIDAIYLPLPPLLHAKWGMEVLKHKKHLLIEKPCTTDHITTKMLTEFARQHDLALHENFAFAFHKQIGRLKELVKDNAIGELRQIRAAFGFPYRGASDFRYNESLGGGALLDCGGYPLKLARIFLGESAQVTTASILPAKGHKVDVFGTATVQNSDGLTAQISFGMDNSYKCELELWGSEGTIYSPRVFTPTADMKTQAVIKKQNDEVVVEIEPDDYFAGSQRFFYQCIVNGETRLKQSIDIERQSMLMDSVRRMSKSWNQ